MNPTMPSSCPNLEVKSDCALDKGLKSLINSVTEHKNEAASTNTSQMIWEERQEQIRPCTDCSQQETTDLSPSGFPINPKPQELESDPTDKPHTASQSGNKQVAAMSGQEVTSMENNNKDPPEADKQAEAPPPEKTTSEEPMNMSQTNSEKEEHNNEDENKTTEETKEEGEEEEEEDEEDDGLSEIQPNVEEYDPRCIKPLGRYNTVSYRKIKRGMTQQRIDEFECMLDV